jgi:hypothetical protein
MKATWTCLNCDAKLYKDVIFTCEICGERICPNCFQDHDDECIAKLAEKIGQE